MEKLSWDLLICVSHFVRLVGATGRWGGKLVRVKFAPQSWKSCDVKSGEKIQKMFFESVDRFIKRSTPKIEILSKNWKFWKMRCRAFYKTPYTSKMLFFLLWGFRGTDGVVFLILWKWALGYWPGWGDLRVTGTFFWCVFGGRNK